MDRRNFIGGMLAAFAGFTILPPATTYGRIWRAAKPEVIHNAAKLLLRGPPFPLLGAIVSARGIEWIHIGGGYCLPWWSPRMLNPPFGVTTARSP